MQQRSSLRVLVSGIAILSLGACSTPVLDDTDIPEPNDIDVVSSTPSVSETDCPLVNTDPADTSVTYTNEDMGIHFTIPYNAKWGSDVQHVAAYVDHPADDVYPLGYVQFGPPAVSFGPDASLCTPARAYEMTYLPARTAAAAEKAVRDGRTEVVPNTTVRTIGGVTVVQFTDVGLCNFPTMEVIGTTYNYSFTTGCGTDEEGEWAYLESIVKSVELTK